MQKWNNSLNHLISNHAVVEEFLDFKVPECGNTVIQVKNAVMRY